MLPFSLELTPGIPVSEQVTYAVRKAAISGILKPGDKFPSIRILSQELKINPNTAQKIISQLAADGILEIHPGIGTVMGSPPPASAGQKSQLLGRQIEQLVVEARQLHLSIEEVTEALQFQWKQLSHSTSTQHKHVRDY